MKQLIIFTFIILNVVSCDSQNNNEPATSMTEHIVSLKDGDSTTIDGLTIKQVSSMVASPIEGGHFLRVRLLVTSGTEQKELSFTHGNHKKPVITEEFQDYTIELVNGENAYYAEEKKFKITRSK